MYSSLALWLVKYRRVLFIFSLLAIALVGIGARNLVTSTDYKIFFDKGDPQLMATEEIKKIYAPSDGVLFLLNPSNGNIFTRENLAAVEALTKRAWMLPFSQRVDSVTNFQHTFVDGDDLQIEDLYADLDAMTDAQIAERKKIALNEPLLVRRLIAEDGGVAVVNAQLALPDDQTLAAPEVVKQARQLRDEFVRDYPQMEVLITGVTPMNYAFDEMTEKDSATLVPIMLLVVLVLCGVMLRSPSSTLITLLVLILSVASAVASMGWLGLSLNNISSIAPVIILTLAVADCIHLLSHYLMALKRGLSQEDALHDSLTINLKPVFLTSLTTAIGFLSMITSKSPPFRELGVVASLGVLFAFIFTLTVLPQLVMWLIKRAPTIDTERGMQFSRWADFTLRYPKALFAGSLVVVVTCMSFIGLNVLNDDPASYFSKKVEFRKASDFAEAHLGGVNFIDYSLDAGRENGINDPVYLAKVEAFSDWLKTQSKVSGVYAFPEILKRLNQNMHNNDPAFYKLPATSELASQYQLLYEMSLPFGMDLNNQINVDKSQLRVTVSVVDAKSKDILALDAHAQEWLEQNASEMKSYGSGPSVMFATIGLKNISSMINGTILATLIISAVLVFSMGSWKLGLISIIPNAFPAAMMLGLWGYFVGEVNIAVAVVFGVTLGIVVDYSVHFMSKYLHGYAISEGDVNKAIHYAFQHVGAALLTTTVVLALGFGILSLSEFRVNGILGAMVSLTIVIGMVFDFIFLPTMIVLFSKYINSEVKLTAVVNESPLVAVAKS